MERKEYDESTTFCKKCFQRGHFTFNCKNERKYLQRPSRTKLMKKSKQQQEAKQMEVSVDDSGSSENKPLENLEEQIKIVTYIEDPMAIKEDQNDDQLKKEQSKKIDELKGNKSEVGSEQKSNQETISKISNNKLEKKRKSISTSSSSSSSDSDSDSDSSNSSSSDSGSSTSSSDSDSSSSSSSSSNRSRSSKHKKRSKKQRTH